MPSASQFATCDFLIGKNFNFSRSPSRLAASIPLPISKKLELPLTMPKSITSNFLIDNLGACLTRRPPQLPSPDADRTSKSQVFTLVAAEGSQPLPWSSASFASFASSTSCISNRQIPELESPVSHRKQTIGPLSNRHKFAFCNFRLLLIPASLPPCLLASSPPLIANDMRSREESSLCKQSTYQILIANEFHSQAGLKSGFARTCLDARFEDRFQCAFQHAEPFFKFSIADHQRSKQADHVSVSPGRNHHQPLLVASAHNLFRFFLCGFPRLRRTHQLHGLHRSQPSDVPDRRPAFLPRSRPLREPFADALRAPEKILGFENVQHRIRRRAGHRIAAKGPAQPPHSRRVHDLGAPRYCGERQPAPKRFRGGENVRNYAVSLAGKHRARPAKSGLHFIRDENNFMFPADILNRGEKLSWRRHESAFAQHRLRDHGGYVLRVHHALESVFQMMRAINAARRVLHRIRAAVAVCIGNPINVGNERPKTGLVWMRFARQRHRQQSPAVKRILEADHSRPARVGARDFHCIFNRLRAAVHEERLLREIPGNNLIHPLRQPHISLVGRDAEAHVHERIELFAQCGDHALRPVAGVLAADSAGKINQAVAVHVLDDGAFRARHENRKRLIGSARHGGGSPLHQLARARARQLRLQLNYAHLSTIQSAARSGLCAPASSPDTLRFPTGQVRGRIPIVCTLPMALPRTSAACGSPRQSLPAAPSPPETPCKYRETTLPPPNHMECRSRFLWPRLRLRKESRPQPARKFPPARFAPNSARRRKSSARRNIPASFPAAAFPPPRASPLFSRPQDRNSRARTALCLPMDPSWSRVRAAAPAESSLLFLTSPRQTLGRSPSQRGFGFPRSRPPLD